MNLKYVKKISVQLGQVSLWELQLGTTNHLLICQQAIVASTSSKLAVWFENQIWNGAGTSGQMNGLITQFAADSDVIKANNGITAIGAAITKANVSDAFDAATAAMPYSLRRKQC